jgi:predicted RNA methylase
MSYTIVERSSRIYNTVAEIFNYTKSSDVVTPIEIVRQQVANVKPTDKVCVPGAGIGTYILALIEKGVKPENITAVELDSKYYELGSAMFERFGVKYVHGDFLAWQPEMQFDVIVGNPPYSDRSGLSSKSKDLDDKFTLIAAERGERFSLIIRSKHFTNPKSSFRKKLFSTGKVVSIAYLSDKFFPTIQNTETCIVTWSVNHSGPAKITYKDGHTVEKSLTSETLVKLNNPNFVAEVDNNLSHRWTRGKLYRGQFEAGDYPIVEICGTGEVPVVNYIREGQEDTGRNTWGVVVNVNTGWGSLGRVMLKPYEASISASIVCLKTDTEQEAIALKEYLLSEEVEEIVRVNMPSFHPTKDLFRKVIDPLV